MTSLSISNETYLKIHQIKNELTIARKGSPIGWDDIVNLLVDNCNKEAMLNESKALKSKRILSRTKEEE